MKAVLLIAVPGGAIFTLFAWRISELLSSDAVAMAIGLTFGVLAGLPAAALVLLARRRDEEDEDEGDYIDAPVTYADEVTPYYRAARSLLGAPPLPERQAQITELRQYLAHLEAQEVR